MEFLCRALKVLLVQTRQRARACELLRQRDSILLASCKCAEICHFACGPFFLVRRERPLDCTCASSHIKFQMNILLSRLDIKPSERGVHGARTCQHISYVAISPFYSDCAGLHVCIKIYTLYVRARIRIWVAAAEAVCLNYVSHLLHWCLPLKALFSFPPSVKVLFAAADLSMILSRVAVRPLDVHILGSNQPLSAGRRYDLLCQSSGSRPPATITWWRNGQRLTKTKETVSVHCGCRNLFL
jgi:CD80-like C2-set immunoglobulin domain